MATPKDQQTGDTDGGTEVAPHAMSEIDLEEGKADGTAEVFSITVVTPRGEAAVGEADEVIVPGALGELGILPGHVPLLAAMRAGVLSWRRGGDRRVLAVGPGYIEVAGNRVVVLTDRSADPSDIDVDAARKSAERADRSLAELNPEDDGGAHARLVAEAAWAQACIAAAAAIGAAAPAAAEHH